jgi:hypothetical protein
MGNVEPTTKSVATLRDLCERAKLEEEAKALLKDELTPRQFLELLIGKELFLDAIRFLAYVLPKREAVGWGCLCVRQILGTQDASKISEAHVAVEGLESPSACLALAAFLSGGSIAPANLEPVAPPDHITPQVVAGAIIACAVKNQPEKAPEKYRVFLQKGMALMARMQSGPKPV